MEMWQTNVRIRQYDIITSENTIDNGNHKKSYVSEDVWSASMRKIKTKISAHEGGIPTKK